MDAPSFDAQPTTEDDLMARIGAEGPLVVPTHLCNEHSTICQLAHDFLRRLIELEQRVLILENSRGSR